MNKQQVTTILNFASEKLEHHPEYEDWMGFTGADITPLGEIIPRFISGNGKVHADLMDLKYQVYQQVWKETVLELKL